MTDANTANTHEIGELVTRIRAAQAALTAYEEARKTLTGGAWVNKNTIEACAYLDECSMAINGKFHEAKTLAAFIALADAHEAASARVAALEAERDTVYKRIARIGDEHLDLFQMTMTTEWTLDVLEERLTTDAARIAALEARLQQIADAPESSEPYVELLKRMAREMLTGEA